MSAAAVDPTVRTVIHSRAALWRPLRRAPDDRVMTVLALALTCVSAVLPPPATAAAWHWPLRPAPAVLRPFTPPLTPWGPGHRGVDLAAAPGQPVYAAGTGRVTFAGHVAGLGVVAVTHGALRTTYLPVTPSVHQGQPVTPATRLGTVHLHPTHCGPHPCLHWGALHGPRYLNPLSLLPLQIRLLPHWPAPHP